MNDLPEQVSLPINWHAARTDLARTIAQHARRINGGIPIILTANLPPAGIASDGLVLIEDAGAGDRNLIIYAGAQRFRIDGGAAF